MKTSAGFLQGLRLNSESGEVIADQAPPPAQEEVVTVAPAAGLAWVGGYWGW